MNEDFSYGELFIPLEQTALVVIDFQEKLLPAVKNNKEIIKEAVKAIEIAKEMKLPVILTEQVPEKIGPTAKEIKQTLTSYPSYEYLSKKKFSCFGEKKFSDILQKYEIETLIFCGIESHVCVLQSVLDALSFEFDTFILSDAVSSRKDIDREIALTRASSLGAEIITVEMMAFELLLTSENPSFKKISQIVK